MSRDLKAYVEKNDQRIAALFRAAPGPLRAFRHLFDEAAQDEGPLDGKTKALLALAISIALRCDGCIVYHVREAGHRGATRDEIGATIGVAVEIGGGPAVINGAEALEAYDQLFAAQ